MLSFGEEVKYFERDAVVVCTSPYILRLKDIHSYVPLTNFDRTISEGRVDTTTKPVPNAVRARIVNYLDRFHESVEPTGS